MCVHIQKYYLATQQYDGHTHLLESAVRDAVAGDPQSVQVVVELREQMLVLCRVRAVVWELVRQLTAEVLHQHRVRDDGLDERRHRRGLGRTWQVWGEREEVIWWIIKFCIRLN